MIGRCLLCSLAVLALPVMAGCTPCTTTPNTGNAGMENGESVATNKGERVPGEYIIAFDNSADEDLAQAVFGDYAPTVKRDMGGGLLLIILEEDPGPAVIAEIAKEFEFIRYAEPNRVYRIPTPPEDPPEKIRRPSVDP